MRWCSTCDSAATQCGENIFRSTGKVSWSYAITSWHNEVKDYNYDLRGSPNGKVVGHYTQVGCLHATAQWTCAPSKGIAQWVLHHFLRPSGCLAQFKPDWLWNVLLPSSEIQIRLRVPVLPSVSTQPLKSATAIVCRVYYADYRMRLKGSHIIFTHKKTGGTEEVSACPAAVTAAAVTAPPPAVPVNPTADATVTAVTPPAAAVTSTVPVTAVHFAAAATTTSTAAAAAGICVCCSSSGFNPYWKNITDWDFSNWWYSDSKASGHFYSPSLPSRWVGLSLKCEPFHCSGNYVFQAPYKKGKPCGDCPNACHKGLCSKCRGPGGWNVQDCRNTVSKFKGQKISIKLDLKYI